MLPTFSPWRCERQNAGARGRFRADARAASAGSWLNKTLSEADLMATTTLRILICILACVFRIAPRSTIGLSTVYQRSTIEKKLKITLAPATKSNPGTACHRQINKHINYYLIQTQIPDSNRFRAVSVDKIAMVHRVVDRW